MKKLKEQKLKEFHKTFDSIKEVDDLYCHYDKDDNSPSLEAFLSSTIDEAELKAFNKGFRLAADKMEELNDKEKNVKLFKKIERQEIEIKLLRAKLGGVKE
jgi:hypothetical protein